MLISFSCYKLSGLYAQNSYFDKIIAKIPNDTLLNILTYDGSDEVVHPDILFNERDSLFYLVITPYPHFNDSVENPCMYLSRDGLCFDAPFGLQNPVINTPLPYIGGKHHNDDPDFSFINDLNQKQIIYLETMQPDTQNLISTVTDDLVHWKKKRLIQYDIKRGENFIVSPAYVKMDNKNYIFYVNLHKKKKNTIEYIRSRRVDKWKKNKSTEIKIDLPDSLTPWHLDIIGSNKQYYMILNCYKGNEPKWEEDRTNKYTLHLAKSNDLKTWTYIKPLLWTNNSGDKECLYVYRATGVVNNNVLVLWYSYVRKDYTWKLGLKKIEIVNSE